MSIKKQRIDEYQKSVFRVSLRSVREWDMDVLACNEDEAKDRAIAMADSLLREVDCIMSAEDGVMRIKKLGDVSYPVPAEDKEPV
jgi:uncharacterized membrane protein